MIDARRRRCCFITWTTTPSLNAKGTKTAVVWTKHDNDGIVKESAAGGDHNCSFAAVSVGCARRKCGCGMF